MGVELPTADNPAVLIHGDCMDYLPYLESIDCVVTDPPYEITASGGGIGRSRRDLKLTTGFTDCGFDYGILRRFDNWVCFGTLRQVPKLIECAGNRRHMLITWNKPNPCPLVNGNYLPDTEYIIHAWRKGNLHGDVDDKRRYFVHPLGDKQDGEHPNEKPVRLMAKLIRTASKRGDIILDPFMGSGTTGVAAMQTGRLFIGIEIDANYYAIAKRRIDEARGIGTLFPPTLPKAADLFAESP